MTIKPIPFTLHIPDADIADLRERLARTRFPDSAPGEAWAYGADVAYLRELNEYWRTKFDWRAEEAALNAFPQFRAPLEDVDLHYLHVPGVGPDPMPLLLLHGWPGSVFEFLEIIPRLTDPSRFGGDARDAFTIVAPSLPGYGLSFKPGQKRFGVPEMADCVAALMTDVLGYQKFAAQGGDWGAAVASRLGYAYPERMIGIHINLMMAASRDPADFSRSNRGGTAIPRRPQAMAARGDRLPVDPGHQAADARLCADRFACRSGGMDRRKIPLLVRLQRHHRARDPARPHAGGHFIVLVYRGDRLLVLALLRASARLGDPASRRQDLRADRLCAIPAGNAESPAPQRRARVHRYQALERHAQRRTFRSAGTAATARQRGAGFFQGIALTGSVSGPARALWKFTLRPLRAAILCASIHRTPRPATPRVRARDIRWP